MTREEIINIIKNNTNIHINQAMQLAKEFLTDIKTDKDPDIDTYLAEAIKQPTMIINGVQSNVFYNVYSAAIEHLVRKYNIVYLHDKDNNLIKVF